MVPHGSDKSQLASCEHSFSIRKSSGPSRERWWMVRWVSCNVPRCCVETISAKPMRESRCSDGGKDWVGSELWESGSLMMISDSKAGTWSWGQCYNWLYQIPETSNRILFQCLECCKPPLERSPEFDCSVPLWSLIWIPKSEIDRGRLPDLLNHSWTTSVRCLRESRH